MRVRFIVGASLLALALATAAPAGATVFRTGPVITVAPGEVIPDDLVAAGQNVLIEGTVQGDVLAVASAIRITGHVNGNVMALAQAVDVSGTVAGSLRSASQTVNLSGQVGRNVSVAAQSASVTGTGLVGRDLDLASGAATIDGSVLGRTDLATNNAQIGGLVRGDVNFNGQNLALRPTARVSGKVVAHSPRRPSIATGALVAGGVQVLPPRSTHRRAHMVPLARNLIGGLALFLTGAVLLALIPRFVRTAADMLEERPGWSVLWGLVLLIVLPIAAMIVILTLIGLPLGLLALAIWGFAILLSAIPVGLWVGRLVVHWIRPDATLSPYGNLAVGLFVLAILASIPLLGGLVRLAVLLFGIGMFALAGQRLVAHRPPMGPAPA